MITMLSDKTGMGREMYDAIVKTREDVRHFNLEGMSVEPCYACRGCEEKTYGKCVIRDDADMILPCLVRSDTIIVFTPIVFGGYSFQIKRVVDKFNLIVDRHYYCRDGELAKSKHGRRVRYYAIGFQDNDDAEEAEVFRQLVRETISIATWTGKAIVMPHESADYGKLFEEWRAS